MQYGTVLISTDCFKGNKMFHYQCVKTDCPDLGLPYLVGKINVLGGLCKLYYLLINIIIGGVVGLIMPKMIGKKMKFDYKYVALGLIGFNALVILGM